MSHYPTQRRKLSCHCQTFPAAVAPPSGPRSRPLPSKNVPRSPNRGSTGSGSSSHLSDHDDGVECGHAPIPTRQLTILAIISLAEQTALNSLSPYLPEMAATFPEVDVKRVGLFVGIIASSFAAAQFATNVFWGRLSDRIGRKPVILLGTLLTSICFIAFGFCRTLKQAIVVQAMMGFVNANAGIVSTVLGEITDKSNQTSVFSWLPLVYGFGGITGPIVGGLLVNPFPSANGPISNIFTEFPYLLPNLASCILLLVDLVMSLFMLDESLAEAQNILPLGARVKCFFTWWWKFTASYRPSYMRRLGQYESEDQEYSQESLAEACPAMLPQQTETISYQEILVPQIILLMLTFTIFNINNIAFNSLYPIYASGSRPEGRELTPKEIGLSLAFAGAAAIGFQAFMFTYIRNKIGNVWCYRFAFLGFVVTFFAMPLVGIQESSSKARIWIELSFTLLIKSASSVGGLTCAMLLITNASPKPSTLGTLNGLAQTLSAGGRAVGPFVSGALFTGGELLAWWVFGGIAVLGLGLSFALRWPKFESDESSPLLDDAEINRSEHIQS